MPQIRTIQSSGSIPTTNQLLLGDIAINTVDGKAYIKKYSGSVQSILEIGSDIVPASASYASTASYSFFAVTAAFAQNFNPSATASYALQALTSSYALVALSSSYSNTANSASYALSSSFSVSSSFAVSSSRAVSSSFASTASSVNTLNQNVVITSSLAVGLATIGSVENTLTLGPPPAGGTGEGGQIMLAAPGGLYTSASMLDTWQDQFRVLRGSNAGSNAGLLYMSLQTGNTQFVGAVTASSYSGLPNDYLYATRATSNQTVGSAWANTDVIFNNVSVSKGISFNTSTGVASLTGGKVYRVTARLAWSAAATYNLQFSCFTSANTQIGPTVEIIQATNGTSNISDGTLDFIYAPGSNTDIKIRCTNNNTALSGEQIRADLNTQFIIQQIA